MLFIYLISADANSEQLKAYPPQLCTFLSYICRVGVQVCAQSEQTNFLLKKRDSRLRVRVENFILDTPVIDREFINQLLIIAADLPQHLPRRYDCV